MSEGGNVMTHAGFSLRIFAILITVVCVGANAQDDQPLVTLDTGNVRFLGFSWDSKILVSDAWGHVIGWNAESGETVYAVDPDSGFACMALSPDRRSFVLGVHDNGVSFYDLESGDHLRDVVLPLSGILDDDAVAFSPDATRVITAVRGKATVDFWDIETREKVDSIHFDDNANGIMGFAFSPDGSQILVSYYSVFILGDPEEGSMMSYVTYDSALVSLPDKEILASYSNNYYKHIAYSPDGSLYAVIPGNVHVYDAATSSLVSEVSTPHSRVPPALAFSPDGAKLLYGPRLHDARTGELLREFPLYWYDNEVAYSPDGNKVAIEDRGTVTIWDVSDLNTAVEDWPERESRVRRVDGVK